MAFFKNKSAPATPQESGADARPSASETAKAEREHEKAQLKAERERAQAELKAERERAQAELKALRVAAREEANAKTPATRVREKAEAKARKAGIPTSGALFVAYEWSPGAKASVVLLVFHDRVEIHQRAELGSILGTGQGLQVFPVSKITSVSTKRVGLWIHLLLDGPGIAVDYRGAESIPLAAEIIQAQRDKAEAAPVAALAATEDRGLKAESWGRKPSAHAERLRVLQDLADDGLISAVEHERLRAEVLASLTE